MPKKDDVCLSAGETFVLNASKFGVPVQIERVCRLILPSRTS